MKITKVLAATGYCLIMETAAEGPFLLRDDLFFKKSKLDIRQV
jgi:hypothetical protein